MKKKMHSQGATMPLTSIAPWECIFVFIRELVEQKKKMHSQPVHSKEKQERLIYFFAQLTTRNKKDSQTKEGSPERFSKTPRLRSSQIAQIITCKHKSHIVDGVFPGRNNLHENRKFDIISEITQHRVKSLNSLPTNPS